MIIIVVVVVVTLICPTMRTFTVFFAVDTGCAIREIWFLWEWNTQLSF